MYDLPDNWQQASLALAMSHDTRRTCAIDIGAHRGILTRQMLRVYPKVVAVEPTGLIEHIPKDAIRHRVALGAASGFVHMRPGTENTGQSYVVPGTDDEDEESFTVAMTTLDTVCAEGQYYPSFVKIDVEGMERNVLLGGQTVIRACKPLIMLEDNGLGARYGNPLGAPGALLEQWGARQLCVLQKWQTGADYLYGWVK